MTVSGLKIVIFKDALERIQSHSSKAHGAKETGGILIGREVQGTVLIFSATGPGDDALQEEYMFSSDHNRLQKVLVNYQDEYGCDYLGEWHKHPGEIKELSQADIAQAKDILDDDQYNVERLILPVVNIMDEEVVCYVYVLDGELLSREEWEVVDRSHPLIKDIFEGKKELPKPPPPSWYLTGPGKKRLLEEKKGLESVFNNVEVFKHHSDDGDLLGFRLRLDNAYKGLPKGMDLVIITPADFPKGPPLFALQTPDQGLQELAFDDWRSDLMLADLLDGLVNIIFERMDIHDR